MSLTEIRILPALAIARLGSSSVPLENFELEVPASGIGARRIVPAPSLYVDESTGAIIKRKPRPQSNSATAITFARSFRSLKCTRGRMTNSSR